MVEIIVFQKVVDDHTRGPKIIHPPKDRNNMPARTSYVGEGRPATKRAILPLESVLQNAGL